LFQHDFEQNFRGKHRVFFPAPRFAALMLLNGAI